MASVEGGRVEPAERTRTGWFRRRRQPAGSLTEEQFERKFSAQFAKHWAQARGDRSRDGLPAAPPQLGTGPSNFSRAQVPYGVDLAAAWSWRFLVIVAAGYLISRAIGFFSLVVMPVVIALFIAALVAPLVAVLGRALSRSVAALVGVVVVLGVLAALITFATRQVVDGGDELAGNVVDGLEEVRVWLQTGPLNVTDRQIDDLISRTQDLVLASNAEVVSQLQSVGTTIGHIIAGFFIVLFATYFFLADGERIWTWVVRLFPRAARARADSSGRVAWLSLTQFVRATVLVALVDAVGIMLAAAILDVPFVIAIGILVFLGGFIPLVGATVSGLVATLVALVDEGPIIALVMLGCVIGVQQLEAHVLQPFLLGRMVEVHPLAVILAIACGAYLAGIAGALVAVPFVASVNTVVVHLARGPDEPRAVPTGSDPPVPEDGPLATDDEVRSVQEAASVDPAAPEPPAGSPSGRG